MAAALHKRKHASASNPPLLVEIQTVDLAELDFQFGSTAITASTGGSTGKPSKSRQVTFLEATSHFLFVGCTSGTVHLFSRESLEFLFMIPFKGGKVCNISVSLDECIVAIASIRGKVSIYRSQNILKIFQTKGSKVIEAFRHLYDVPCHNNGTEITELKWSTNGKYLFVGDSQGVVSQTDIGILDEFPRPPPSRIILTLQSRILQIDCIFPFLAIATINASYLCDLEKEDFTRIQSLGNVRSDIKSGGLCLVSQDDGRMFLLLGEVGTGHLVRCRMDGSIEARERISALRKSSTPLFDPKKIEGTKRKTAPGDLNFSPGKMFPTSDGQYAISVSSNRVFIYDSNTSEILLWNEDFNRINSFKIFSNYGFLWYANKLVVFALTEFRPYGRQLFKAGLKPVVESWVGHALLATGYTESTNDSDKNLGISQFREMMDPVDEDDEFCQFVDEIIPFDLTDPEIKRREEEEETYQKKLQRKSRTLASEINGIISLKNSADITEKLSKIFHLLQEFYSSLGINSFPKCPKTSELTLFKVIGAVHGFLKQPKVSSLRKDLKACGMESVMISNVSGPILNMCFNLCCDQSDVEVLRLKRIKLLPSNQISFSLYASTPIVAKYFNDFKANKNIPMSVPHDAVISDILALLLPLIEEKQFVQKLKTIQDKQIPEMFFLWTLIMTCFPDSGNPLPFRGLLRTIINPVVFDKLAEDILETVYRDILLTHLPRRTNESLSLSIKLFHHFVTFTLLYSHAAEVPRPRSLTSLLLTLFPIKRSEKEDITQKIVQLCKTNPFLTKLFQKACLKDGKSLKLCLCSIPACRGTLDDVVPPFQRAIEEAVLIILAEDYDSEDYSEPRSKLVNSPVHQFAMKRCLIEPYLKNPLSDDILPDRMKILLILRAGICSGLKYVRYTMQNLKILKDAVITGGYQEKCSLCRQEITSLPSANTDSISMDCVGAWALENCGTMEKFLNTLIKMGFNQPGEFSIMFFQFVIQRDEIYRKGRFRKDPGFGSDFIIPSKLSCSFIHDKIKKTLDKNVLAS